MRTRLSLYCSLAVLVLAVLPASANAQVAGNGAIWENTSGGGAALRAPGNMVQDGVARGEELRAQPLVPTIIVETAAPSFRNQTVSSLFSTIFTDLNNLLFLFLNLLFERAGFDPLVPDLGALLGSL